jgi:hypothetical protein
MNINRTGMRTVLAAAAAGALILGSAAGATATPSKGKPEAKAGYLQATKVDFHRHSPVNVFGVTTPDIADDATSRDVKVRATVRDTSKTVDPTSVKVTVSQYEKGKPRTLTPAGFTVDVPLATVKTKKHEKVYSGILTGASLRTAFATLPVGAVAYVCIADLKMDVTVPAGDKTTIKADRKHVTKKENGGSCIKVINVDPTTTKTERDDPKS